MEIDARTPRRRKTRKMEVELAAGPERADVEGYARLAARILARPGTESAPARDAA